MLTMVDQALSASQPDAARVRISAWHFGING
jgi:hypothetical protein